MNIPLRLLPHQIFDNQSRGGNSAKASIGRQRMSVSLFVTRSQTERSDHINQRSLTNCERLLSLRCRFSHKICEGVFGGERAQVFVPAPQPKPNAPKIKQTTNKHAAQVRFNFVRRARHDTIRVLIKQRAQPRCRS